MADVTEERFEKFIDKDAKVKRNNRMFAAWLACDTEDEIAEGERVMEEKGLELEK